MKRTFGKLTGILAALLAASCSTVPPRPVTETAAVTRPAAGHLKLADWNMEFLATKDGTGCHPRGKADYAAIRRTVEAIDADVFAFEEVENEAAAARVFDPAKYAVVMEQRPGQPGGNCGREHPAQQFIRQAVGIAIRRGIPFDRQPDLTALQLGNPNLRSGVEVILRPQGGAPLRVLAVHLKSGCFQGETGPACPTIMAQAPVLRAWLEAATKDGMPFAIMGDWNRRLALPGDSFWQTINGKGGEAGLVLTDKGTTPHCDPQYHDFIDHIVLDRKAAAQPGAFTETTFPRGQRLSDHCPILNNISGMSKKGIRVFDRQSVPSEVAFGGFLFPKTDFRSSAWSHSVSVNYLNYWQPIF